MIFTNSAHVSWPWHCTSALTLALPLMEGKWLKPALGIISHWYQLFCFFVCLFLTSVLQYDLSCCQLSSQSFFMFVRPAQLCCLKHPKRSHTGEYIYSLNAHSLLFIAWISLINLDLSCSLGKYTWHQNFIWLNEINLLGLSWWRWHRLLSFSPSLRFRLIRQMYF